MAGHPYCKSLLLLSLAFLLFIAFASVAEGSGSAFAGDLSKTGGFCASKCSYRCSATSHKKPCLFFCNKCCKACNCVPAGTYGNKQSCPCYNNWKTKEGGPKCP